MPIDPKRLAKMDVVREQMIANLRATGVDPASPAGKQHIADALKGFLSMDAPNEEGFGFGQLGGPQPFTSGPQAPQGGGLDLSQSPAAAAQAAQRAPQTSVAIPEPMSTPRWMLDYDQNQSPAGRQTAPRNTVAVPGTMWDPKWMKDPEKVQDTVVSVMARVRPPDSEGRGKWIPFAAMPQEFRSNFAAEVGEQHAAETAPGGWWSGDLEKRDRELLGRLVAEGAREKSLMAKK